MAQEELYGQQKRSGYPGYNLFSPKVSVPGQLQGETVNEFAQAKQGGVVPSPVSTGSSGVVDKPLQATSGVQTGKVGAGSTPFVVSPNSSTDGMDYLGSLLTTQADEERMRKASLNNRRIMAVSDALRHIGNIYNTANYATPQQFNSPVLEEKARYEKEKSVRDAANLRYYSYKQAKAAQDAKQRQWEQQFQLNAANAASQAAYRKLQGEIAAANAASQDAYRRGNLARQEAADKARNDFNERKLKQDKWYKGASLGIQNRRLADQQRRTTAYVNRQSGSGGSGVAPLDTPKGKISPNAKNYTDQVRQLYSYAEEKGYIKKGELQRKLAEMGIGNETPDAAKRQLVMDALRGNQSLADYAESRLGWTYSGGTPSTNWDEYAEDDNEDWNDYLED